jgi:hypothetical protein
MGNAKEYMNKNLAKGSRKISHLPMTGRWETIHNFGVTKFFSRTQRTLASYYSKQKRAPIDARFV